MEKIYYISQGNTPNDHLKNIEMVCNAGVGLVQLRLKNVSQETYNSTAIEAMKICVSHGATLIVNDNIEAALTSSAHGVHLGKKDLSISEATSKIAGKMIGGTANTLEDCLQLISEKVDYIGLGPFRFTETKSELSPLLGIEGYRSIMHELSALGHSTPVFAIGGITSEDVAAILATNVYGVAVSGILTHTPDVRQTMNELTIEL